MTATSGPNGLESRRQALEAYLAEAAGARSAEILAHDSLTGGAIQENWGLRVAFQGGSEAGERDFVLRTDAVSSVAFSHSRAREFALLKAAFEAGVLAPEPLWLCEAAEPLGKPFYVMRRVWGTAAGHKLVRDKSLGDGAALAVQLGEQLARIHSITPPREGLAFLGAPPEEPALSEIAGFRAALDALPRAHPELEWGLRWCELHAPPPDAVTLIHQDYRTGNYMVQDGRLTGILDWEFCAWGDPVSDIGWFCAKCWRFGSNEREAGGIAAREPFYRGYAKVAGIEPDPERVAYWEVMAHLRWAVIALQQGERFNSSGEESLDLALTGRVRPLELAMEILEQTPPARWTAAP